MAWHSIHLKKRETVKASADDENGVIRESITSIEQKLADLGYVLKINTDFQEFRRHLSEIGMYDSPIFDPDEHDLTRDAFWLQVIDSHGNTIACHAERVFTCADFVSEKVETDQIWFSRGVGLETQKWRTKVNHPPIVLRGRVSLAGSMFVDRQHRGTGVSLYLPYLSRSICLDTYATDWNTGLVRDNILNSRIPTLYYGYPRTALLFSGTLPRSTGPFQDIHLCWISREESIEKIRELSSHPRYPLNLAR